MGLFPHAMGILTSEGCPREFTNAMLMVWFSVPPHSETLTPQVFQPLQEICSALGNALSHTLKSLTAV